MFNIDAKLQIIADFIVTRNIISHWIAKTFRRARIFYVLQAWCLSEIGKFTLLSKAILKR